MGSENADATDASIIPSDAEITYASIFPSDAEATDASALPPVSSRHREE